MLSLMKFNPNCGGSKPKYFWLKFFQSKVLNETAFGLKFHGEKNYQNPTTLCNGIHLHKYGWFKWLYSIKKSTELRLYYENNNNTKYDWVLLTDPQTIPSGDFIIPKDKKPMHITQKIWGGYQASFLLGTDQHANHIGEMYDYFIEKKFEKDKSQVTSHIDSEITFKNYINIKYSGECSLPTIEEKSRYWKGHFHKDLSPETLKKIIEEFEKKYPNCDEILNKKWFYLNVH